MLFLNNNNKTIYQHLADLKKILLSILFLWIVLFVGCFYFSTILLNFLQSPVLPILAKYGVQNYFITTSATEVFFSNIKQAFYFSLFIAMPFICVIVFFYIISVLQKTEKTVAIIVLCFAPLLFLLGLYVAYAFGFSFIWNFFIGYSVNNNITLFSSLADYLSFSLSILLAFGLSFELPVLIIVLGLLKIITPSHLIRFSRYAIVIAFIIAAIFTPPDPFSQIIMAILLIFFYFLAWFVLLLLVKK
jgi:sec-independent protein translocase protein TatC